MSAVIVQDSRMPIMNQKIATHMGPKQVQWNVLQANNPNSVINNTWNIVMAGRHSGISRKIVRHIRGRVTFNEPAAGGVGAGHLTLAAPGATAAGVCQLGAQFGIQPNAIASDTVNVVVKLGQSGVTCNYSQVNLIQNPLTFYTGGVDVDAIGRSGSASCQSRFNNFTDAADQSSPFLSTAEKATSDVSAYPNSAYISQLRCTTAGNADATNFITSAVITFDIYEDLPSGLFANENVESEFIYGLDTITITSTQQGDWRNYIKTIATKNGTALATPLYLNNITFEILANEILFCTCLVDVLPEKLLYVNRDYQFVQTPFVIPNPIAATSLTTNQIMLPNLPYGFLIWAGYNGQRLVSIPDIYLPITSVTINYGTSSGVFSNCVAKTLYNVCVNNGLNVAYPNFAGLSVIGAQGGMSIAVAGTTVTPNMLNSCPILIKTTDLGSIDGLLPGMMQNKPITFTCNINPVGCAAFSATASAELVATSGWYLNVVTIYDQLITLDTKTGSATQSTYYMTPEVVKSAEVVRQGTDLAHRHITGGSWLSDLGDTAMNILGSFKDGATLNIPGIIDRVTGKKHGFGRKKGGGLPQDDDDEYSGSGFLSKSDVSSSIW